MSAASRMVATRLLTFSYFKVFPGMALLWLVGLLCLGGALSTTDTQQRFAWLAAAGSFCIAVPALFAGSHFRAIASRRSHALLPGFAEAMVAAALTLFVGLGLGSAVLYQIHRESNLEASWAIACCGWSLLFWFGFLPTWLRVTAGFSAIALTLATGTSPVATDGGGVTTALIITVVGWLAFWRWFSARVARFETFERVELAHWNLPLGLNWGQAERIGTSAGTLLLGIGDAPRSRLLRAALGVLVLPGSLFLLLYAALPTEQSQRWIGDPVISFLALAYALGYFTHLTQRGAQRLPLLWLRLPLNWVELRALAERVLIKEWLALAAALSLLNLLVALLAGWKPVLLALSLCWLAGLLLHLQLALTPWRSASAQIICLFAHLLALSLALAIARVSEDNQPLWAVLALQLAISWAIRRHGLRSPVTGQTEAPSKSRND